MAFRVGPDSGTVNFHRYAEQAHPGSWWARPMSRAEFDATVSKETVRMNASRLAMATGWEDECQPRRPHGKDRRVDANLGIEATRLYRGLSTLEEA